MSILECKTADRALMMTTFPILTAHSKNVDTLTVEFDATWDAINAPERYAQFTRGEISFAVPLHQNQCGIPVEMLAAAGRFSFAVFAKNAAGEIVKTSKITTYHVYPGADPGADVYIDWPAFKAELIAALNDRFNLSLTVDDGNDAILAAIAGLENGAEVRAFWLDFINTNLGTSLTEEMSDDDVAATVAFVFDQMNEAGRQYGSLAASVAELVENHVDHPSGNTDPAWLAQIADTNGYCSAVETALANLYTGGNP